MTSILSRNDAHRDVCIYLQSRENKIFSGSDMKSSLKLSADGLADIIHDLVSEGLIKYSNDGWRLTTKGKKEIEE